MKQLTNEKLLDQWIVYKRIGFETCRLQKRTNVNFLPPLHATRFF